LPWRLRAKIQASIAALHHENIDPSARRENRYLDASPAQERRPLNISRS
jgi:hypothetical protein